MKLKSVVFVLLASAAMLGACFAAHAAGPNSLEIIFVKEDPEVTISGADVAVYKAADADLHGTWAAYTVSKPYASFQVRDASGYDVTFDGLTASQSAALAKKMAQTAADSAAKGVTNENGVFSAKGLENGLYLVVQTGRSGVAAGYTMFEPFLVAVPSYRDGIWVKDVVSEPKTSVSKENTPVQPETKTPETTTPETSPSDGGVKADDRNSGKKGAVSERDEQQAFSSDNKGSEIATGDVDMFRFALGAEISFAVLLICWFAARRHRRE